MRDRENARPPGHRYGWVINTACPPDEDDWSEEGLPKMPPLVSPAANVSTHWAGFFFGLLILLYIQYFEWIRLIPLMRS
ncbi:hypothetical protein N7E02_26830 [Aliirhizobium terrae]|uniref:hypothetical protein n=1 Tax=Terrirhizobium terrae TaxID=2926709 RepID=UPI0025791759|nr:hypothetical protein [Rhizobium sp. CC-CFT758]WJH40192.1 hypothetical protein N7E02_26830 [Rhizobium sp. CC-CFT758]